MLKERTIGVELFGRDASYDTSGDSIVRVKANEVRKRLAQYYQEAGARDELRIQLPTGSYVPEIQRVTVESRAQPARAMRLGKIVIMWGSLALAVALAAVFLLPPWSPFTSDIDRFWAPVLSQPRAAIVCMGTSQMVHVSRPLRRTLERIAAGETSLATGLKVGHDDFAPATGEWVAKGNFFALRDLALLLHKYGKPAVFRPTSEIAFDELRDQPIILIGAFNNKWTMEFNKNLRFWFEQPLAGEESVWMVRDRTDPQRKWSVRAAHPWKADTDYAIITRLVEAGQGRAVVSAAGISGNGTQAAGDFITSRERWREFARGAPKDWHRKNIQIVLETKVVAGTPNPARVVASHIW